jgi:hypothetical protein
MFSFWRYYYGIVSLQYFGIFFVVEKLASELLFSHTPFPPLVGEATNKKTEPIYMGLNFGGYKTPHFII